MLQGSYGNHALTKGDDLDYKWQAKRNNICSQPIGSSAYWHVCSYAV